MPTQDQPASQPASTQQPCSSLLVGPIHVTARVKPVFASFFLHPSVLFVSRPCFVPASGLVMAALVSSGGLVSSGASWVVALAFDIFGAGRGKRPTDRPGGLC
ncbi:hypothetical protein PTT_05669 [Pyrenophora teres f. teres 0-1]|uniref:Uncharacterized protein n=1 Tax=Pyrenophora teres f. teres (strain 0-1) TaxID=861557 RepID=E3RF53_PYRTT|nr:hypothetical protein PTT_05669 [Pyrenophora teres f. teres 0-1]